MDLQSAIFRGTRGHSNRNLLRVAPSTEYCIILINKVPHCKVSNFIRAKVPSCPKRKLVNVLNLRHYFALSTHLVAFPMSLKLPHCNYSVIQSSNSLTIMMYKDLK